MQDYTNPFDIEQGGSKSPIKKYVNWRASVGEFTYKAGTDENEQAVYESLGEMIYAVPMAQFIHITGEHNSGGYFRSNQIASYSDVLEVVTSKGEKVASGTWKEIKDTVKASGGLYTTRMYAMVMASGIESEIVAFDIKMAFSVGMIESKIEYKMGDLLKLKKNPTMKKNKSEFYIPDVTIVPKADIDKKGGSDKIKKDALALWPPMAEYLNAMLNETPAQPQEQKAFVAPSPSHEVENETDALPF